MLAKILSRGAVDVDFAPPKTLAESKPMQNQELWACGGDEKTVRQLTAALRPACRLRQVL